MSDDIPKDDLREFAENLRDEAWEEHPPGRLRGCKLLIADEIEGTFDL